MGYIISFKGISIDFDKIFDIKEWFVFKNVKEFRSFLGFCFYYCRFVKGFSNIVKCLYKLIEKGLKFRWNDDY